MMELLIEHVTVVNADGIQGGVDILIRDGKIKRIGSNLDTTGERIDGTGLHAFPGLIDLHCHLRDPGLTHKEDIASGTRSAAAGGFTTVCCMPNTKPALDGVMKIKSVIKRAKETASARVLPVATITKGLKGKQLTDFKALKAAGAIAFSDDGLPVVDDAVILLAMAEAKKQNALLMLHEEDIEARGDGIVHDGENAKKAGLKGISRAVEDNMTARDIFYAQKLNAPLHICHVSTVGSMELVRRAKQNGARITCETMPHYFALTDEEIVSQNPNAKVNPPLREAQDRQAVVQAIVDGTVDAIATDHAPHTEQEKAKGMEKAPCGLIGFETAFSLVATHLYHTGLIQLEDIARLMSKRPAEILQVEGGEIKEGATADIALCNMNATYTYTKDMIYSKSKNSPFIGRDLRGKVVYTIWEGKITHGR